MNTRQAPIDALKGAMKSAQDAMDVAIQELVRLEDAYPPPAPAPIQRMKGRISDIIQNWTDACNWADTELRKL